MDHDADGSAVEPSVLDQHLTVQCNTGVSCPSFLSGGGRMGALIRQHDWGSTPFGAATSWPQSIRSALSICLNSNFPTAIYWGSDLRVIYNDAWSSILGERHPWALGRPAVEVWPDIWDVVGPQFSGVLETGEGFTVSDQKLSMLRGGMREETFWEYNFTPIRGENGAIVGIFNEGRETTGRVVAQRRSRFLLDLSDKLRSLADPFSVVATAQAALGLFFGANRVGYGEVDEDARYFTTERNWTDGTVPSREGQHDLAAFGTDILDALRRGDPLVIRDVARDPRTNSPEVIAAFEAIETKAAITASLVKEGRMRAALYVHASTERRWTTEDSELVTEVADRTWSAVERILAEARLRSSEEQYQAIVNSVDQMIWSTRPDGYHDYYNDRWYEYTGVPHGSTDGEAWNGLFHPDDQQRAWDDWRHSLETGEPYRIEYRLRHRSGEYRWVIGRAHCLRDSTGRINRWFGSCTDIHDHKLAENTLAERTRVLSVLNRTGEVIASELDLERVVQTVTDAGVELTGARFGAFFYNLYDEEKGERYTLYTVSGVERDQFEKFPMPRATHVFAPTFRGEGVVRSDDITADPRYGRNAPYKGMPEGHLPVKSYLAVPVRSRSGEVLGGLFFGHPQAGIFTQEVESLIVGIAGQAAIAIDNAMLFRSAQRELAERERKETALKASEEFSRSVVESSGDCIKVLDLDGTLHYMNDNGRSLMEIDELSSVRGRPWQEFWAEVSRPDVEKALNVARSGGAGHFSAFCPSAKGTPKWWDVVVTPVPGPDGQPVRLVSISRDVTEQRRSEEARQLLMRELNHRVKNLFAISAGMVTMTARTAPSVEAMADVLKGRLLALAKAHELIRSAISSDVELRQKVELKPLLNEVLEPHRDPHGSCQTTLGGPEVQLGVSAATSFALIAHELATNAVKYGSLGQPAGRLNVFWSWRGSELELCWREYVGGEWIGPPSRQGFGTQLANASATGQLGGSINFDWQPDGLRVVVRVPQASLDR